MTDDERVQQDREWARERALSDFYRSRITMDSPAEAENNFTFEGWHFVESWEPFTRSTAYDIFTPDGRFFSRVPYYIFHGRDKKGLRWEHKFFQRILCQHENAIKNPPLNNSTSSTWENCPDCGQGHWIDSGWTELTRDHTPRNHYN